MDDDLQILAKVLRVACPLCKGIRKDNLTQEACESCSGTGIVRRPVLPFADCGICTGTGKVNVQCKSCRGTGEIRTYIKNTQTWQTRRCFACSGGERNRTDACKDCRGWGYKGLEQSNWFKQVVSKNRILIEREKTEKSEEIERTKSITQVKVNSLNSEIEREKAIEKPNTLKVLIRNETERQCVSCRGTGIKGDADIECGYCSGWGRFFLFQKWQITDEACDVCGGEGKENCISCEGTKKKLIPISLREFRLPEGQKPIRDPVKSEQISSKRPFSSGEDDVSRDQDGNIGIGRVPWFILPGEPTDWDSIQKYVKQVRERVKNGSQKRIFDESRFSKVQSLRPDCIFGGLDAFDGYIVFQFSDTNVHVLECGWKGNAIYVIQGDNWRKLSRMSKSELLDHHRDNVERIIHRDSGIWFERLRSIIRNAV
jgi:DnaJ-class molecular chaperone